MSPVTHLLLSWLTAEAAPLDRRGRALVAWAGVAPDLDGLGIVAEVLTKHSEHPLLWFSDYHHVLLHNGLSGVVAGGVATAVAGGRAGYRLLVGALVCLTWNLHLLCDLIGAQGPDGFQWPIPFAAPFSSHGWAWSGQWRLDSWQNLVITMIALGIAGWLAWTRGRSPVELVSSKADAAVVGVLRRRFPFKG